MERQRTRRGTLLPTETEEPLQRRPRASHARRIRRKRRVLIGVIAGVVLLVGVGGWVGVRGLIAKAELEAAIPLANRIKDSLLDNDPERASALLGDLQQHTTVAVELTGDPVWRVTEFFPFLGSNLTAFREAAEIVALVADDGLEPVVDLASTIDISSFKPIDGQINLQPLLDATEDVERADDVVNEALTRTRNINTTFTIGAVTSAVAELDEVLDDASGTLSSVRTAVNLLPSMLGVEGPRNYLLMFQNNAETRSLGGNPASLALINVDNGRIDLVAQASGRDFPRDSPPIAIDPELLALYAGDLPYGALDGHITNITHFPDFAVVASLAKGFWERQFGTTIDAVASFDPVALSYLLKATGPVTIATGDVLTADNVVPLVLSDVYTRYEDFGEQDQFFAAAAKGVFDVVKSGKGDSKDLITALSRAVDERRLLLWSSVPEEQEVILTTTFSGILPTSNVPETTVASFFNGFSTSKLNYYTDVLVSVDAPVCEPEGFRTVIATTVTSHVPLDPSGLAAYVLGTSENGVITYDIVAIGPVGAAYESFDAGGGNGYLVTTGFQDGRPVARIRVSMDPGQTNTVTVAMTSPAGEYGPLKVLTTPMVRETPVTVADSGCPTL